MKHSPQELEALIDEIANPNFDTYSHGIFGCFDKSGHYLKEIRGHNKILINEYACGEKEYLELFERERGYPEFKARVWAEEVDEGFKFRLIFNDKRGDRRDNSHTDYTLFVPKSKISHVNTSIKSNPALLIKVFQKVFPNYDRSNGTLCMHDVNPYFEQLSIRRY